MKFSSKAVRGSLCPEGHLGAVSVPIYQTSTFAHKSADDMSGYDYSRCQNPTREELEKTIALLEGGSCGFAFASGLAANLAVFSLLSSGDHVVVSDDIYGGTYRLIETVFRRYEIEFTYVDPGDLAAVAAAMRPETRLVFIETPTNPMMKVADIRAVSAIARRAGALCAVDNTFLTPYFQRPLELGADIVVHSGTKYLNGHNDTMAGLAVVRDPEIGEKMRGFIKTQGAGLAPFDAFLVLRGMKTLPLRMKKHEENAMDAAQWLQRHPKVTAVYYPGLPQSPGFEVSRAQASGFGGMISFSLQDAAQVHKALRSVRFIIFAESLGGTESLITYPMTQTHASIPEEIRNRIGITDRLLRLSVGIEDIEDILEDLERALA